MSDHALRAVIKTLNAEVSRILWEVWDPIGVRGPDGDWPDDEYDSYVGRAVRLAYEGDEQGLVTYLQDIAENHMGLRPRSPESQQHDARVGAMIIGATKALLRAAKLDTFASISDSPPPVGSIVWHDIAVPDAERVRDFYAAVVGWKPEPVDMGGYSDFNMVSDGEVRAGVCFNRGPSTDLPPQWVMYIKVADFDRSLEACEKLGGTRLSQIRGKVGNRFCVVRDPAGAVFAIAE